MPAAALARRASPPCATLTPREARSLSRPLWRIASDTPGRLRVRHPLLRRFADLHDRIDAAFAGHPGVLRLSISPLTGAVLVRYRPDVLARAEILEILSCALSGAADLPELEVVDLTADGVDGPWFLMALSGLSFALALASLAVPALAPAALSTGLAAAAPIAAQAVKTVVFERRLNVDVLDTTALALLFGAGRLVPASLLILIVDLGDVLLATTSRSSRELLADVLGHHSSRAWRIDGDRVEAVDAADVVRGDLVLVRAGDTVPADGEVVRGAALIDQHVLTGEFVAVERGPGEKVFAMTTVISGEIVARVSAAGADTNAARIVAIIEESLQHKTRMQSMGERFADLMVAPTFGLAGLGYWLSGPSAMVGILNSDYGTGIRVAAPLALLSALSGAARQGILVKDGAALESLYEVTAVVFDKTGTLTTETPEIGRILSFDPAWPEERILAFAAAAEQQFQHPIARAIRERTAQLRLSLPSPERSSYELGMGLSVRIDGLTVRVGSFRFLEKQGVAIPAEARRSLEAAQEAGRSAVMVGIGERLVGLLELRASTRPEAARVIDYLRDRWGLGEIHLVSGDQEAATSALAQRLGIPHHLAETLPEDKAAYVRKLQDRGLKVMVVGDGINDSIALSQADFSVSLHGAADVATDVADVIFLEGNLARFDLLLELSDKLHRNIRRSFWMTLVPNSVCIAGALAGVFGIGTSILLNNVFNLLAAMNGLLPYYQLSREAGSDEAAIRAGADARQEDFSFDTKERTS